MHGEPEVEAFLTHLGVERKISGSTQNQAMRAILFLYKEVLGRGLEGLAGERPLAHAVGTTGLSSGPEMVQ